MSVSSPDLDEKEFYARDGALTVRLTEQILSGQFELDPYQEGVGLVLLPTDDSALARLNLERAMQLEERGFRVNLRIIQPTKAAKS